MTALAGKGRRLIVDGADYTLPAIIVIGLVVSIIVAVITPRAVFPEVISANFPFVQWIDQADLWLRENFRWFTRGISDAVGWALETLEIFLLFKPWPVVLLALTLPALTFGGLRLAIFTVFGVLFWGSVGMWDSAISTLSLMGVSVVICVVAGVGVGVLCAGSDRVEAIVRPILDTMQVMPAFVYLIPAIFFFGVGPAAAAMAIIIYALPPAVRLTNLGIRQVPDTMLEAGRSFGATRLQMLAKVQIPHAMPSIMLGVNQTIMMALALAVLAVFVGAGGLGEDVWKAIRRLKVGWSFEGGLAIVFMAIIFDRLSYAMSGDNKAPAVPDGVLPFRLLPQSWDHIGPARAIESVIDGIWRAVAETGRKVARLAATPLALTSGERRAAVLDWAGRHAMLICGLLMILALIAIDAWIWKIGDYPKSWRISIREPIDRMVDALTISPAFIGVTQWIRGVVFIWFLRPLDNFLLGLPWWYMTGVLALISWRSIGWRFALVTTLSLLFVGAAGYWAIAMYTIAATAVSVIICIIIGAPIGVAAAYSRRFDAVLRPILDTMQVMPSFVYLIPALFFFGGNPTTAIIATVVYAVPPMIRMTTLGLRQVPAEVDEVARSFGASPLQTLLKAKLPLASPSIMLGINQATIMALAMQTITPLIAGLGLGKEVYDAVNRAQTGQGLAAGIGIVLIAIVLDRLSMAWTRKQRAALGIN